MKTQYNDQIDRLYLQMYSLLFEYARSSLSNDSLAEEAVHDTFVIACQKPESLFESPNPEGWLVITLKNVISNTIRKQSIAKRILTEYIAANSNDTAFSEDRIKLDILYNDIADMEEFKLLKEMIVDGRSYLEMAESRQIRIDTCRKRVERAIKKLREKLSK